MATDVSQRFNVDVAFIFGSLWEDYGPPVGTEYTADRREVPEIIAKKGFRRLDKSGDAIDPEVWEDFRRPAQGSITDWSRRCIDLPSITKSVTNWQGQLEVTGITFTLANTDGAVTSTFATYGCFGKPVGMFVKVSENPQYWMPVFSGNIVASERSRGLVTLTVEDNLRNLYNSQFVSDYVGIATTIDGVLYGTVRDVIGTNVYIDDRGDIHLIKRSDKTGADWSAPVVAGAIGGVTGFIAAGPIGGIIGFVSGLFSSGVPEDTVRDTYYYKVNDYNAIPEGLILGGQNLKFYPGSVSGAAQGGLGSLYGVPAMKTKGGRFENGIYGTVELDDARHTVRKGDYVYSEVPTVFVGSPDTVIENMLCGSNSSIQYFYPSDFSRDWVQQTKPLRHMQVWAQVNNFETGGVAEAIDSLARELGFSFYLDEENRFAIRALRERDLTGSTVIGTLAEDYNILGEGVTRRDDLRLGYTDLELSYMPEFGGDYQQTIKMSFNSGTYYGGQRRVLTVNSQWIHDHITGAFMATRMARRYGTVVSEISGDVSLYSVPFQIGDIVSVSSEVTGSNQPYEITGYTKSFARSVAEFEAEAAGIMSGKRGFWYMGTDGGACSATSVAGFGTMLATIYQSYGLSGHLSRDLDPNETEVEMWRVGNVDAHDDYFTFNGDAGEILKVAGVELHSTYHNGISYEVAVYKVFRGWMNTRPRLMGSGALTAPVRFAGTCFNMDPTAGTIFRWY